MRLVIRLFLNGGLFLYSKVSFGFPDGGWLGASLERGITLGGKILIVKVAVAF